MTDPISALARHLSADLARLQAVSQNVANSSTPGYRAQRVEPGFEGALRRDVQSLSLVDGALQATGRSLDLAATGNSFFVVQTPAGPRLSRAGAFHLDGEGRLLHPAGHPVLGTHGPLVLPHAEVRIDATGAIHDGSRTLGQLQLVGVDDGRALRALGDGLYALEGAAAPVRGAVHQGLLEGANVAAGDEMVRLIELTRHAESVQRAVSAYDQMLNTGINRIGDEK